MTTTYSSQAGLASFCPAPQPATIYAAVIEWPTPYEDTDTALILERTPEARAAEVRSQIEDWATQVDDANIDRDLEFIAHLTGDEWITAVMLHDLPFISLYERTV